MISFDDLAAGGRFSFRVAAVIERDKSMLFERSRQGNFLFLPGGRLEFFEDSHQGVLRELHEELGVVGRVDRLLWICENFFLNAGRKTHELGLYYLCSIPDEPLKFEAGRIFEWHRVETLSQHDVRPSFLIDRLARLPLTPERLVVRESKMWGREE